MYCGRSMALLRMMSMGHQQLLFPCNLERGYSSPDAKLPENMSAMHGDCIEAEA